jgi:hypothetical protein
LQQSSRKWAKNGEETIKTAIFQLCYANLNLASIFFIISAWLNHQLIVGELKKKKNQKFKKIQKIEQIFKKFFFNLCHGSKMASRTLLNGSGVLF